MSALVLVVGALVLAAGGYEMVAGSGDILSERGWSAYIAGSVLVAGGVVTMALGLALRALDRLRVAITRQPVAASAAILETGETRRFVPTSHATSEAAPELPSEPEPTVPMMTAPMIAAPPIAHPGLEEPYAAPLAAVPLAAAVLPAAANESKLPAASQLEPLHEDWVDTGFSAPEREVPPPDPTPVAMAPEQDANVLAEPVDPAMPAPAHESPGETVSAVPYEGAHIEPPLEVEPAGATISAREEPAPPSSSVIGRYESEGTSYVMYADGSIDAQSEAGVYRFASMAELKAFIES